MRAYMYTGDRGRSGFYPPSYCISKSYDVGLRFCRVRKENVLGRKTRVTLAGLLLFRYNVCAECAAECIRGPQ